MALGIIINGDDLGDGPEMDSAIFGLMARGRITSATILANGPSVESAAREASKFPACSFGVHLNVTQFEPLTSGGELRPLLDQDGRFAPDPRTVSLTQGLAAAIEAECNAQIRKLQCLGINVSHIDSHHHVHTHPPFFPLLKRVQRRFGIRRVRCGMNLYSPGLSVSRLMLLKKLIWKAALRSIYRTRTTDGFTSFLAFFRLLETPARLRRMRTLELMTHPGLRNREFPVETALLDTAWEQKVPFPVRLINYNDL